MATYRLYARWSSASNRVNNATYQVHHAGGMTPVQVDQKGSGGIWVPLGDFDFDPAAGHKVELLGNGSGGYFVTADAVRFVRAGGGGAVAGEIVVDNLAATKVGTWTGTAATSGGTFWGTNFEYRNSGGTGANSMTWTPTLASAGRYQVYTRWNANAARTPDARYTVSHDGGATPVTLDQRASGGIWVPLGSYELTPGQGHGVLLTDEGAASTVAADAVKFVPDGNSRAVMADAIKLVPAETPAFPVVSSTLQTEYITLNGRPLAVIDGGSLYYVHPDHLGTPQKMTDGTGAVVWDAVYRAFGEAESVTGSAQNDQRFPGQLYDAATGFHYNYFRDYAPGLGRYVQSDPIELRGGLNTFAYVGGNPLIRDDPLGLAYPIGEHGTLPSGERVISEDNFEKRIKCEGQCLGRVLGSIPGIANAASGLGALPISKVTLGVPTIRGASTLTNPISATGLAFGKYDPKIGKQILGTNRLFRLLGRLNLLGFLGLTAYDLVSFQLCVSECMNQEDCNK